MSLRNRRAFSLPEVMVSAVLTILVAGSSLVLYMMISKVWNEDLTQTDVSRGASVAVEKMVRGADGNDGIREAKSITSPIEGASGTYITFTDMNDSARQFYFDSGTSTVKDESGSILASNVKSLYFTNSGECIQIDLSARKYILGKEIGFSIQTKVKPRN